MCGPVGRVSELLLHIRALRDCLRNDYDRCILYMYKFILSSPRYIDDAIIIKKKENCVKYFHYTTNQDALLLNVGMSAM